MSKFDLTKFQVRPRIIDPRLFEYSDYCNMIQTTFTPYTKKDAEVCRRLYEAFQEYDKPDPWWATHLGLIVMTGVVAALITVFIIEVIYG